GKGSPANKSTRALTRTRKSDSFYYADFILPESRRHNKIIRRNSPVFKFVMDILHQLHDPEGLKSLIATGGYLLLFAITFAETGLLIGFFLPGDSLLFVAGTLCAVTLPGHDGPLLNIAMLIPLLCVAAIVGDAVGYMIGRKVGPALF